MSAATSGANFAATDPAFRFAHAGYLLTEYGTPEFGAIMKVLNAMDVRLEAKPKEKASAAA